MSRSPIQWGFPRGWEWVTVHSGRVPASGLEAELLLFKTEGQEKSKLKTWFEWL